MTQMLAPGQPAPWFHAQALSGNARYTFDTAAGRWVVMLLMGSGAHEAPQAALKLVETNLDLFDDKRASFFGVTVDPADVNEGGSSNGCRASVGSSTTIGRSQRCTERPRSMGTP